LVRALASALGVLVLAALAFLVAAATSPRPPVPASPTAAFADRVVGVSPELAVRLGPSGTNVIDLAVGDDALYTLDVVENSVRAFGLDAREQPPLPDTLVARTGAPIIGTSRRLAQPVAIQYFGGGLTIVDNARALVQVGRDRNLSLRTPQSSATWGELGALGTDLSAHLFVLDTAARRLLDYAIQNQRLEDPPRLLLERASAPDLAFDHTTEVVGLDDSVYLRFEDGTVRRFDTQGNAQTFTLLPPDGRVPLVAGITADRMGGLYLADAANGRVLHTTADGAYVRELRHPALAGLRQLKSSLDGRRLYGLVTSGILTFDVPDADPGD
jgi:hypothetical protein